MTNEAAGTNGASLLAGTAPVAADDTVSSGKNIRTVIDVLANDSDADGALDPTTVVVVDKTANGTLSVNATTGKITYTPTKGYVGTDSFTYTVKDADGNVSEKATVTIDVASKLVLTSANEAFVADAVAIGPVEVDGGNGDDYISGSSNPSTAGADRFFGGEGNDIIFGASGDDYIEGNAGNDFLRSGSGNDTLVGGEGVDTYGIRIFATKGSPTLDSGTVTIIDDDGILWNGAPRPASVPAEWSSPPPAATGYQIAGTAKAVADNSWTLTIEGDDNVTRTLALSRDGNDLKLVGGNEVVTIKNYVNGTFGITLEPNGQAPTDLALSNNSVAENSDFGTVVGTLSAVDPEGKAVTFALADDAGGKFRLETVNGVTRLVVAGALDFETAASHTVKVTATDPGGNATTQSFTVDVSDVDEAKGNITVDASGSASMDFEAFVRGGFTADTSGGGFPSFDNGNGLSGKEMFIGYGDGAGAKYVLMQGDIQYSFKTHTVAGTGQTVEYGVRGNGSFDANGAFVGGDVALRITGLNLFNAVPADDAEAVEIEANGPVHNFAIAHMYGAPGVYSGGNNTQINYNKYADALDDYAQTYLGSAGRDVYTGSRFADVIKGNGGNDLLAGGGGNDQIDGGSGEDLVKLGGTIGKWTLTDKGAGKWTAFDGKDTVSLANVELLLFDDKRFDLRTGEELPLNFAPKDIALSSAAIAENAAAGTLVGTLSAFDPDGDSFTWSLDSASAKEFTIVGNELRSKVSFDHEASASRTVTLIATDAYGASASKTLAIAVLDVEEAPNSLKLSKAKVAENSAVGTVVGTFSAVDPEGKALSWALTDSANGLFKLSGSKLVLAKGVDYEALKSDTVTVKATDAAGLSVSKTFKIDITDVNEAPRGITLSKATIAENSKVGTTVGVFSANDPDGDKLSWTLSDSAGGLFKLSGSKLQVAKNIDYEKVQSDTVKVVAKDGDGLWVSKTFTIKIGDVQETIAGDGRANKLTGGIGSDVLKGHGGDDVLKGGKGNDILVGGKGADDLWGGSGADTFRFVALSDSTASSKGRDTIFDFNGKEGDRIDLSSLDADATAKGNQSFDFIGTKAFSGEAGELRFHKTASNTYIYADTDGDKVADFGIHLDDAVTISKGYLLL